MIMAIIVLAPLISVDVEPLPFSGEEENQTDPNSLAAPSRETKNQDSASQFDQIPENSETPENDAEGVLPDRLASSVLGGSPVVEEGPGMDLHDGGPVMEALWKGASAEELVLSIEDSYYKRGFDVASGDFGHYEEESALTFTYEPGDINQDGTEDLVMHTYCVDFYGCPSSGPAPVDANQPPPFIRQEGQEICGTPHVLYGVSGGDKEILWDRVMSQNHWSLDDPESMLGPLNSNQKVNSCYREVVLGSVPITPDIDGILVYGFRALVQQEHIVYPEHYAYLLDHRIMLIDSQTGSELWVHEETGHAMSKEGELQPFDRIATARNLVVDPVMQIPSEKGVSLLPEATTDALFLQGVGFDYVYKEQQSVGSHSQHRVVDQYDPQEWAKRIDIRDGTVMWESETFVPVEGKSVWPSSAQLENRPGETYSGFFSDMESMTVDNWNVWDVMDLHWDHIPCCFDQTGDGIPDMAYLTYEWDSEPASSETPDQMDVNLYIFDGQSGELHVEQSVANETRMFINEELGWRNERPLALAPSLELVGDVDADGASDIMVRSVYRTEDFRNELSVRSGTTGEEIWSHNTPKQVFALPIGDSSGNGGNDLVVLEWFDWEYAEHKTYDYTNVTTNELTAYQGSDGRQLWQEYTYQAPIDVMFIYNGLLGRGLPDFTGDGVADLPVDDPFLMDDLTVVHRMTFLDGQSGTQVFDEITSIGTFSIPMYLGDYSQNGTDDFVILTGDVNDLWVTLYDGVDGKPFWSSRVVAPRMMSYYAAEPNLRVHLLDGNETDTLLPVINLQIYTLTAGTFQPVESVLPQILVFEPEGRQMWSLPEVVQTRGSFADGATPATQMFEKFLERTVKPSSGEYTVQVLKLSLPGFLLFAGSSVATALLIKKRWS